MEQTIDLTLLNNNTGIYTNRYCRITGVNQMTDRKDYSINIDCGRYKVVYNIVDAHSPSLFGLDSWKCVTYRPKIVVSFYENDQLLFTKTGMALPCIIIHCLDDVNQSKENTLFSIREDNTINIYNMNNEFIRKACIGHGPIVDFKRVNKEYGIGLTEEMCCNDPFTGLFKLDIFFGEKDGAPLERPYDNSRTYVPLSANSQEYAYLRLFPLICTETGFLVEDLKKHKILADIIPYDKVWLKEILFDDDEQETPGDKMYEILQQAGFNINQLQQQVIENGGVSILAKDLPANVLEKLCNN